MQTTAQDKSLYAAVAHEIADGIVDGGLWTKAYAKSGGIEATAKALYNGYRYTCQHCGALLHEESA